MITKIPKTSDDVNRLSTSGILFFPNRYISGYREFFRYTFTLFPSSAPFSPSGSVGYISSSVIAPENGLAAHISFTSISNSFANRKAKSNRILESDRAGLSGGSAGAVGAHERTLQGTQ